MGTVNLYIHEPCPACLEIVGKVRELRTPKIHFWVSHEDVENCEDCVRRVIENWRDGKIVDQNIQTDNTIGYYEWDLSAVRAEKITSNGLKALIHRSTIQQIQFAILGNSPKCKGRMVYFVDAPQRKDLPNSWQSCRWMTTYNDIVKHCHEQGVFDFDLADTSRFSQTDKIVQGARVYKELSTGRLVYLDNFHKTHYEVFSSRGAHLGEMSLGGKLNQSTADNQKRLDL